MIFRIINKKDLTCENCYETVELYYIWASCDTGYMDIKRCTTYQNVLCLHKITHICKGHTACVDLALYTQDDLEDRSAFPMGTAPAPKIES
jgi:hypothetical protein